MRYLTVTFDVELLDVTLTKPPWSIRYNDQTQEIVSLDVVGSTVVMRIQDVGADVGADIVSYDDTLEEVVSRWGGLVAPSFTDYPLT